MEARSRGWRWPPLPGLVLLAVGAIVLTACGGDDSPSQAELNAARKEGAQEGRQQQQLRHLKEELKQEQKEDNEQSQNGSTGATGPSSGGGTTPFSGTDCGGGVLAGANTSCPFAQNVATEFHSSGGATQIHVYSPVTGLTYTMSCTPGQPNICRGGNNASVAFP